MKKTFLIKLFVLFSCLSFGQTFNNSVLFNKDAVFKGKTIASNDSIRFTAGGDTLTIGVRNNYGYITCYSCDSIFIFPPISGSGGGGTDGIDDVLAVGQAFTAHRSIDMGINNLTIDNGGTLNLGTSGGGGISQLNSFNTSISFQSIDSINFIGLGYSSRAYDRMMVIDSVTGRLDWKTIPSSGSSGLTIGSTTITSGTTGRILYDNAGMLGEYTTVPVANGGTNISSYAVGDIIYASGTTTLAKLADVATTNVLISGGVGVAPSYGKVALATAVSGTLDTANSASVAGVIADSGITVATSGKTKFIKNAGIKSIASAAGLGSSIIKNTVGGTTTLKRVKAGSNITVTDGGDSLIIASTASGSSSFPKVINNGGTGCKVDSSSITGLSIETIDFGNHNNDTIRYCFFSGGNKISFTANTQTYQNNQCGSSNKLTFINATATCQRNTFGNGNIMTLCETFEDNLLGNGNATSNATGTGSAFYRNSFANANLFNYNSKTGNVIHKVMAGNNCTLTAIDNNGTVNLCLLTNVVDLHYNSNGFFQNQAGNHASITQGDLFDNCTIGEDLTIIQSAGSPHENQSWGGGVSTFSVRMDVDIYVTAGVLDLTNFNYAGRIVLYSGTVAPTVTISDFTGWSPSSLLNAITFTSDAIDVTFDNSAAAIVFPTASPVSTTILGNTFDYINLERKEALAKYIQTASVQY